MMYMVMSIWKEMTAVRYSIAEARRNLPKLVREAENGRPVELTRHGQPVAVLIGRRSLERIASGYRRFTEAYNDFTSKTNLAELALDPDELFADVRDKTPGRDFQGFQWLKVQNRA